jgi:hypothetical protein
MRQLIFVIGPPAAGKTSVCQELLRLLNEAGLTSDYFCDAEVLRALCDEDVAHNIVDGGVLLTPRVRRELYRRLADRVLEPSDRHYAVVELAPSKIAMVFGFYPMNLLKQSFAIEVRCTLGESLNRNQQRGLRQVSQFNAHVPEAFIKQFFRADQHSPMRLPLGHIFILENSGIELVVALNEVQKIFNQILAIKSVNDSEELLGGKTN